nr:TonB-dependent siderophore receptor [Bradyrhizobium prioritasuperba]
MIGAAFLLGDLAFNTTITHAQSALPAVTVEAPTQGRKPARPANATARRAQAIPARRRDTHRAPAAPTASERAAAAAAAQTEARLGYRPSPSSTTLRTGASPLETSQVVNVVPAQVISDQLPRNLDDALVNVSGITQTNTLGSTQDAVMRRGFGDNRDGSIMRNGMPLVQGRSLNAAVESVEVLKGPASLLYGIMDPGGIVNTISKRPELTQRGSISVLGSTYGGGKNGGDITLDLTGPIGDGGLAYRLIAYGVNEDYWRNFGRRNEGLIAPSLAWYGENTTVQLNYEHRDFYYPFDRGTALNTTTRRPLDIPATRRIDEPFDNMWGQSDLAQITVDHKINEDWKVHAGYSYNRENYDAYQLRVVSVNPTTGIETRSNDGTLGALSYDSYGTAYVQGGFWIGGMRNEVLLGADAEHRLIYRRDLLRQTPVNKSFNVYNPIYGLEQPSSTVSAPDSDQTDNLHDQSLYFQDTLHVTKQLSLVGGVRYEGYRQIAGKARPFQTNTDIDGAKALPLAGAVYKLTDQVSLYASYTQSLKPTSAIAALVGGGGFVITGNLAPEEGTSWETGIKFDFNKRLSGTVALYTLDKRNVLVSQLNNATGLNEFRAIGGARSRGVEVDVTGRLNDNWSMIGTYAYTDGAVTDDPVLAGKRLQNVAMNTGSLYLVYDFRDALPGRLRVGAGAHYVGDRPGTADNAFVLPAYTVADGFATYETKYETLPVIYQLNVKNIFNTVYYPSAVNTQFIAVGDARRVSLSATVKF